MNGKPEKVWAFPAAKEIARIYPRRPSRDKCESTKHTTEMGQSYKFIIRK